MGYRESFIITALSPLFDFVHHRLARKQQSSNEKYYRHDKQDYLDPVEEVHQLENTPLCRTLALLVIQTHDELTRDNYIHQSHYE
jgi:hypothetical protein